MDDQVINIIILIITSITNVLTVFKHIKDSTCSKQGCSCHSSNQNP